MVTREDFHDIHEPLHNKTLSLSETIILACFAFRTMKPLEHVVPFIDAAKNTMMNLIVCHLNTLATNTERLQYAYMMDQRGFQFHAMDALIQNLQNMEVEHRFRAYKARVIQRAFRNAIANANSMLCRKRLLHEWEDLIKEMNNT